MTTIATCSNHDVVVEMLKLGFVIGAGLVVSVVIAWVMR